MKSILIIGFMFAISHVFASEINGQYWPKPHNQSAKDERFLKQTPARHPAFKSAPDERFFKSNNEMAQRNPASVRIDADYDNMSVTGLGKFYRIYDKDFGIACYAVRGENNSNLECVPASQNKD